MNLLRICPVALMFPVTFLGAILSCQSQHAIVNGQDKAETKSGKKDDLKFVRVSKEAKMPLALQTAVVKYKSDSKETEGVEVSLIGAVHIAEKSYYEKLNKLFTEYDALLYEMVSDPHRGVPAPNERGSSPVSSVQVGMKDMLELTFQLDGSRSVSLVTLLRVPPSSGPR